MMIITCYKILKSVLLKKEAFPNFFMILKTDQTTEFMWVVNFEIHLLPNRNFFLLRVFLLL
jgi:hypothetical protein